MTDVKQTWVDGSGNVKVLSMPAPSRTRAHSERVAILRAKGFVPASEYKFPAAPKAETDSVPRRAKPKTGE